MGLPAILAELAMALSLLSCPMWFGHEGYTP